MQKKNQKAQRLYKDARNLFLSVRNITGSISTFYVQHTNDTFRAILAILVLVGLFVAIYF